MFCRRRERQERSLGGGAAGQAGAWGGGQVPGDAGWWSGAGLSGVGGEEAARCVSASQEDLAGSPGRNRVTMGTG